MATGPESIDDFSAEELQNLKQLAQDVDEAAEELGSTRRDVIKSLGLLGTGIAAGGISAQQLIDQVSAQASTTDGDGNVGLPSDRVDVFADGLDGNSATLVSLSAEQIGSERHYAGAYDGADPDTRLDNALTSANPSDTIYLENQAYDVDRTFSADVNLVGTGGVSSGDGSRLSSNVTWTFNGRVIIERVAGLSDSEMVLNGQISRVLYQEGGIAITTSADRSFVIGKRAGSVTFESGTSGGIVDASSGVAVTDNGTNTVGDIA